MSISAAADEMEEIAEPTRPNVIHVDFGHRERAEEMIPDPEEREDDE